MDPQLSDGKEELRMRILLNEEKSLNLEEEKGYLKFILGC